MIRRLLVLAGLFLLVGHTCQAADPILTFPALFGTWKVDRMVGATEITGDEASSRRGLGAIITISASLVSNTYAPSSSCKPRNPMITEVDTEAKLENDYGTKGSSLYLPMGILKQRMPYLDVGCESAFILDHDTLLWTLANGFIYTAKREQRIQ